MIKLFYIRLIILSLSISATISIKAQFGYSPAIDSMVNLVTLESLTLLDRQLSGDTTVIINGNVDSIMSRYSNSIYNPKAAQFILEKFQSFGLFARFQNYDANGQNVIAIKNGIIFPDKEFIVCAHYDDVPSSGLAPGADDNASGVCGVIEAARIFSGFEFPYTLKFIAFDEEEQGLIGSAAYADSAFLNGDDILGVINLDMIAWDANGDFQNSVASNDNSMPLFAKFIDILKTYQPQLSPHLFYTTASDHYRFWGKSYKALLNIEDWQDFNAYYHTIRDSIPNIDMPFFLTMTRGSLAALASLALDYKAEIIHSPLSSLNNTLSRVATINLTSPYTLGSGINAPRLYYKADEGEADFVNPFYSNLDTVKFMIPGQPPGSKVSYYFAVQDAGGNYIRTLPAGGRGIDPPGEQAPPEYFSFYVLNDTTELFCMTGLPQSLPVNNNIKLFTLNISKAGEIHDINVKISVTHTNSWDLDLYLVAPDGREVELSTKNGYNYDHYTNTVFDDEASTWIHQNKPPFTGSFKPEKPLAMLDDTTLNGNWKLKIRNRGSTAGQLTVFCMEVRYSRNNYYVDGNKTVSGNGRSWSTAFRTITEATIMNPSPGTTVFIKPATYNESVRITSNGTERISLTTGISLSNGNKVQFPTGTNLSGISLSSFPGEYYAYIFRSRLANNGVYRIIEVNDAADFIRVEGADFIDESGIASDSTALLGSAGRPVIYKKYTTDPLNERVILDANQVPVINSILYIGDSICDGSSDALPANYNIIDGIDLTNSGNCGGIHLQSSSFNYICNSRIYQTNGTGIYINGNQDHPALFNIIKDNFICNTPFYLKYYY